MDAFFDDVDSGASLTSSAVQQLIEAGFVVVFGAVPDEQLPALSAAYDDAVDSGTGPDYKVGSTTTRLNDLVNRGAAFDEVFLFPPLLKACRHLIGRSFKLSSLLGRTLRPHTSAQELHVDLPRDCLDSPMVGFILMIDPFLPENGATRFVPGSQDWIDVPSYRGHDLMASFPGERLACGPAGSMVIFNAAIWHGHTANCTAHGRRSIQGYFVRREARSGTDFSSRMRPEALDRISPLARYLLALS